MKWLRLGFAMLMGFGAISSFIAGQIEMTFFFIIVCAITIWSISWGGKNERRV